MEHIQIKKNRKQIVNKKTPNEHLVSKLDSGQQCTTVAGLGLLSEAEVGLFLHLRDIGTVCCDMGVTWA